MGDLRLHNKLGRLLSLFVPLQAVGNDLKFCSTRIHEHPRGAKRDLSAPFNLCARKIQWKRLSLTIFEEVRHLQPR